MQTQIEQQSPRKSRPEGKNKSRDATSEQTSQDVVRLQLGFYDGKLLVFVGNIPRGPGRDIVIFPDGAEHVAVELVAPPGFFASAVTLGAPEGTTVGPWQCAPDDPSRVVQTWSASHETQRIELVAMAVQIGGDNRADVVATGETRIILKPR